MCSFKCYGQCCGILSVCGIFFLFSVGHMFATEPMFTDPEVWHEGHGDEASFNCYMGGVIYICTLVASIGCILYDKKRSRQRPAIAHDASLGGFVANPMGLSSPPSLGDFDNEARAGRNMAVVPLAP